MIIYITMASFLIPNFDKIFKKLVSVGFISSGGEFQTLAPREDKVLAPDS